MKKTFSFLLFLLLIMCISCNTERKVRIFIAGDSTAQTYDTTQTDMRGWGQMLPLFLPEGIEVFNHAKAGRSTKSFRAEGRWDSIMNNIQQGDYVIIQFAHNDTSTKPERHASPSDFRNNLIRFITEAQAKGANPILLTPIVMRTFQDGNLTDNRLKTYPGIIREVAGSYNVPMVDINLKTRDLILKLGEEESEKLYMPEDDTHTNEKGAREYARFVAEGLEKLEIIKR